MREYRANNLERVREHDKRSREKRKDAHKAYAATWYQAHKDQVKEASAQRYQRIKNNPVERQARKEWKQSNPELTRGYSRVYRQRHRHRVAAYVQGKNAKRRKAQPLWANERNIKVIYRTASVLSKLMKQKFEVDHIYPLNSPFMCGLHVETNLRVISREENMRKSNRHWPGQLPCQSGLGFEP